MPTGPRPGAPATVNLGAPVIQAMLGDLPHAWLLSLYALIDPITFQVDELCAVRPPEPESWGFNDAMNALDPATAPLAIDKLIRMAKASVWNTYCHEIAPPEDQYVQGPLTWRGDVGPNRMPDPLGRPFVDDGVIQPEAELWIFVSQCITDPTTGDLPQLTVTNQAGDVFNVELAKVSTSAFGTRISVFSRSTLFGSLDGVASFVPWPDGVDTFRMLSNGSDGDWAVNLSAWSLAPAPPSAWPAAPELPTGAQFTDACVTALCAMATEWNDHRVTTAILPGMVTEARNTLVANVEAARADVQLQADANFTTVATELQTLIDRVDTTDFTPEQVAQLAELASAWPAQLARSEFMFDQLNNVRADQPEQTAIISGALANMYDNQYTDSEMRKDAVLAAIAAIGGPGPTPQLALSDTTWFSGNLFGAPKPDGAVLLVVQLDIPEYWSRSGDAIPMYWDLAYLAWEWSGSWHPSQRIKHQTQICLVPEQASSFSLDLSPGIATGGYYWATVPAPQ